MKEKCDKLKGHIIAYKRRYVYLSITCFVILLVIIIIVATSGCGS